MFKGEYLNESNLQVLLEFLYPNGTWVKNQTIPKEVYSKRALIAEELTLGRRMFRPDYRNEEESIIVEFDGIAHYQDSQVIFNDISKEIYYEELGYKFIQIPYFVQPTKSVVKEFFNIEVENDLTDMKNGFNIVNGKLNKSLPASFSEHGVRRFISEFNRLDISSQNQIIESLYENYSLSLSSTISAISVLPVSLINFLEFELVERDKEYLKHFVLENYKRELKE